MKVKKLVVIGVASLLAVSLAYATPSAFKTQLVDDLASNQQLAANDPNSNIGAMDNNAPSNPGAAPADASSSTTPSGDMNNPNPGSDEDTQDTATGDSDY